MSFAGLSKQLREASTPQLDPQNRGVPDLLQMPVME